MNENKFLKNLSQPINHNQAIERIDNSPTEYDPIKRLTDELSRHSGAIEGLNTRIDRMEQRPKAATQAELQALLEEARAGVSLTIDSEGIARLVLPELKKGMPTSAGLKAAADAGAGAITAAGTSAAERIEQAGSSTRCWPAATRPMPLRAGLGSPHGRPQPLYLPGLPC